MSGGGDEPLTLDELGRMSPDVLTGIGPKRLEALAGVEIENMLDLLTRYPRRYLDRSRKARLEDLAEGEEATVLVEVERVYSRRTRGGKSLVSVDVSDGSGRVRCTFFNQPWRERQLPAGSEVVLFGKIERYQGRRVMNSPLVDFAGDQTGRIVALYPQSEKARIASADYAGWIKEILRRSEDRGFADPVPEDLRNRFDLTDRGRAFRNIHRPETMTVKEEARRRLVFDELLRVQLALVLRKRALEASTAGIEHRIRSGAEPGALVGAFHDRLQFELTSAQRRAIDEINEDLAGPHPMHRLLQGDVGSGKTVVALSALLVAVEGGHQGAFMAPTEVLAEQHYGSIRDLLTDLTVPDDSTLLGERALRLERLTSSKR